MKVTDTAEAQDLAQQIRSLTELWNRLYGDVMYRITEPQPGDPVCRLFGERIREHGYDAVREAVIRIGRSRYLLGLSKKIPMSLIWFLHPDYFKRVLKGSYDDYRYSDNNRAYPSSNAKDGLQRNTDLDRMAIDRILRKNTGRPA